MGPEQIHDPIPEAESIRREHLPVEAVVRAAAVPLTLAGLVALWVGVTVLRLTMIVGGATLSSFAWGAATFLGGAGAIVLGLAVRSFRRWSRKPAIMTSALMLIVLVIRLVKSAVLDAGLLTLVALVLLPLAVLSLPKSAYVFSAEYELVRASTPHLRYRPPLGVWGPLALLIAILATWIVYVLRA